MPTGLGTGSLLALGAAGATVLSSIMAPDKTASSDAAVGPAPTVTPPTPMPDEGAIRTQAKRASLLEQQRRRGRASTILTDPTNIATDPLGG